MKKDKPKVNDQENIQRINKDNKYDSNSLTIYFESVVDLMDRVDKLEKEGGFSKLVHQLCSEMLGFKREIEDLKAEVKLNELRSQDEFKDINANIKLLMKERKGVEVQNMTDKEAAIIGLNRMLFGDKNEK